jgi:hypothetical protein
MAAGPDDPAQAVETYLYRLPFLPSVSRLRFEYRDTFDEALGTMNTQLRFAYEQWRHFRYASVVLDHLESIRATCDQRLNPVCKTQYHLCITMLRAEISRAATPEADPEHQDAHLTLAALASLASPTALADVHIKDPTHAGMEDVPALLASLHHLSAGDHAGEYSSAQTADRERAAAAQQERERKEQQKIDEAAAVRFRQFQQVLRNREETE